MSWRATCATGSARGSVSFLFVDVVGQRLLRVSAARRRRDRTRAEAVRSAGQHLRRGPAHPGSWCGHRTARAGSGCSPLSPIAATAVGVLEVSLPSRRRQDVLEQVEEAAHALAYIIVTDRRFTDLYHWGNAPPGQPGRGDPAPAPALGLLLRGAQFTLAGGLVPAADIAGDTYDYTLDHDTLHLSITDAMGHDVDAALMATLLVNASRGARRAGARLARTGPPDPPGPPRPRPTDLRHRPAAAHRPGRDRRPARQRRPPLAAAAARRHGRANCASPSNLPFGVAAPRAPTGCRTSTCAPVTAWCSTPTACRNASAQRRPARSACHRRRTRARSCAA